MHVRYKSLHISSAQQKGELTKFFLFWRISNIKDVRCKPRLNLRDVVVFRRRRAHAPANRAALAMLSMTKELHGS